MNSRETPVKAWAWLLVLCSCWSWVLCWSLSPVKAGDGLLSELVVFSYLLSAMPGVRQLLYSTIKRGKSTLETNAVWECLNIPNLWVITIRFKASSSKSGWTMELFITNSAFFLKMVLRERETEHPGMKLKKEGWLARSMCGGLNIPVK